MTISTGCNVVSSLGKSFVNAKMDFSEVVKVLKTGGWKDLGLVTATSYLVSTVPALVGYGVSSMVDNGLAKQVLSVPVALGLTVGAECFTDGFIPTFSKPPLENFAIFHGRDNFTWENFKSVNKIQDQKLEMIDFANTFIQTELFNIFLPDAALDFAEIDLESITDTIENDSDYSYSTADSDSIYCYENGMADYSSDF